MFGKDRGTIDEAWPGDIIGLVNASGLAIGDTVVDLGTKPPADFIRNAIPNPESCE